MKKPRLVIVGLSEKGGAGKTTAMINPAGALARLGVATTLLDADPQATITRTLVHTDHPILSVGARLLRPIQSSDEDVIRLQLFLSLIPGDRMMDVVEDGEHPETSLAHLIANLGDHADVVVIDTPGRLGHVFSMTAALADCIIIPTRVGGTGDLAALATTLDRVEQGTAPSTPALILPMDFRRGERAQQLGIEELLRVYGARVAAPIPHSALIEAACNAGVTLADYAPKTAVARAFDELAVQILALRGQQP